MTGKYPVTGNITDFIPGRQAGIGLEEDKKLKVPEFSNHLDTTLYTLGDFASDAGLLSASIGKWHLGDTGYLPENHGFDLNVAGTRSGMPVSYYWPYQREYKDGRIRKDFPELRREGKEGDYLTDQLTDKAIDFITENHDTGFLLYFSFYNVHIPIEGKPGLVKKYRKKLADGGEFLHRNVEYAAMVESVDQNIGRVLDALDSLGLKRNTLIIFTSDNGGLSVREGPLTPATTNYPYREGKGYIYEGGIREPFIIYWPGVIDKAYVSDHPIIGTDILPTLADLFSLPDSGYEGESLVPLIRGDSIPERALFWHYPHYSNQGGKPASAVRKGKYKLIQFLEGMNYELYDVVHDPGETTNLAEELPGIRAELSKILDSWRERNNASMPVPNPIYKPDN
jgi:arylsulfatase A-like enzyme